jgi:polysaccharide export outer membrane protein
VLDLAVDRHPELSGKHKIGPDGRIDVGSAGRLRVEGLTVPEIARNLAEVMTVPPDWVHLHVAEYASQEIYLIGQVTGLQRAVPYQGPETVLDLLRRVGGITPGAAPDEVYVVRSHLAEGRSPEVFRVDLRALVLGQDLRTNVYVQPLDQIFVGETRKFSLAKCMPPWLRPAYEAICGIRCKPGTDDKVTR